MCAILQLVSAPSNPRPIVDHFRRSHPLCEHSYWTNWTAHERKTELKTVKWNSWNICDITNGRSIWGFAFETVATTLQHPSDLPTTNEELLAQVPDYQNVPPRTTRRNRSGRRKRRREEGFWMEFATNSIQLAWPTSQEGSAICHFILQSSDLCVWWRRRDAKGGEGQINTTVSLSPSALAPICSQPRMDATSSILNNPVLSS